jgi:hypothetical protein
MMLRERGSERLLWDPAGVYGDIFWRRGGLSGVMVKLVTFGRFWALFSVFYAWAWWDLEESVSRGFGRGKVMVPKRARAQNLRKPRSLFTNFRS